MSNEGKGGVITRNQASKNKELQLEVEAFNPYNQNQASFTTEEFNTNLELPVTNVSEGNPTSKVTVRDSENISGNPNIPKQQNNSNNQASMALANNQTVSLKDALKVVPEFNGTNIPLSQFLEGCAEAGAMVGEEAEANLCKLIRSRLYGEARGAISGETFDKIEALQDYLKEIYAPAKSVHQLLGELGNEFQRDNESVISYANRMREIGRRIIEAHKIANGTVGSGFKTTTGQNVIDCFKRGLKPEIEQRLANSNDMVQIVRDAIKIERQLEAQNILRNHIKSRTEQNRPTQKKNLFICQICREEGHEANDCKKPTQQKRFNCEYCKRPGHSIERCFQKAKETTKALTSCQLCNKTGHIASQCYMIVVCQVCNKTGHTAKLCQQNRSTAICQICNRPGHVANNCFQLKGQPSTSNNAQLQARASMTCQTCNKIGHTAATCRVRQPISAQPNNFNAATCAYCKNRGHTITECRKRYEANKNSGNGPSLQKPSTQKETYATTACSQDSIEDMLCKLVPLD